MMAIAITWKFLNSTLANESESCNYLPANFCQTRLMLRNRHFESYGHGGPGGYCGARGEQ